ncbi:MAG: hypothetical protein KDI79_17655 [Anaerolineae bacterium]|nr:hypothetical protein [Anaerolineae bacterium]
MLGAIAIFTPLAQAAQVTIDFTAFQPSSPVADHSFSAGDEDGFHLVASPTGFITTDTTASFGTDSDGATLTVTQLDGSIFEFQAVDLDYIGAQDSSSPITASGYLNGVLVATDIFDVPYPGGIMTYSAVNLAGKNVDRLVFTFPNGGASDLSYLDNLVLEDAPTPTTGTIVIAKSSLGEVGTFNFTSPQLGDFSLTTQIVGPDASNADTTFDNLAPGTYSVAEEDIEGWTLLSVFCTDADDNIDFSPDNLTLSAGQTIECVFINQKDAPEPGNIIVVKQIDPHETVPTIFSEFETSYSNNFFLQDRESNNSGDLAPGTYSVREVPEDPATAVLYLDSATCDDGSDPSNIQLDPGETVTCTFVNKYASYIAVEKITDPSPDLTDTSFNFTTNFGAGSLTLKDGDAINSVALTPGTYSVSEESLAGWQLTSATCVHSGSTETFDPSNIVLGNADYVTCTFVNKADNPVYGNSVDVAKSTSGYSPEKQFEFEIIYDGNPYRDHFFLSDGNGHTESDLEPGTYSVREIVPEGWYLDIVTVNGTPFVSPDNPVEFFIDLDEEVVLLFENLPLNKIIVKKETIPDGNPTQFEFESDFDGNFFLADGETYESDYLRQGTYSISELTPPDWDLTDATCDDGSDPSSIELTYGDIVTCTFTNTLKAAPEPASITIKKVTTLGDGAFAFSSVELGNFDLTTSSGTAQQEFSNLTAGEYDVTESVPSNWTLTGVTCEGVTGDDWSRDGDTAKVNASAGDNITCTFTNTPDAPTTGTIIIVKDAQPNTSTPFVFTLYGFETAPLMTLIDDGSGANNAITFADRQPGTYGVQERPQSDWALSSLSCNDNNSTTNFAEGKATIKLEAGETVTCTFINIPLPPPSGNGCTPGYWKQKQHRDSWAATGYSPDQKLKTVFANTGSLGNKTLLQALSFKGGSSLDAARQILLRAGVPAVLNAAHPDVAYPRTTDEVINSVNSALASNDRGTILALATQLDNDNNLGCNLGGSSNDDSHNDDSHNNDSSKDDSSKGGSKKDDSSKPRGGGRRR